MMPKTTSARWLAAISVVAVAVAAVSVIVTLAAGTGRADPLPEGSPERVAQLYILAIEDEDAEAAYALLHESVTEGCALSEFQREVRYDSDRDYRVTLDTVEILPDGANVFVETVNISAPSPFEVSTNRSSAVFFLRQSADEWRIARTPYPFQGCPYRDPTPTPRPTETEPLSKPAESEG